MKIKKINLAIKFSFAILIISMLGVGLLAWLSFREAEKIFIEHTAQILKNDTESYANEIANAIKVLKNDLLMLSYNNSIRGFMRALADPYHYDSKTNKTAEQFKKEVQNLFVIMAQQNPAYFQVRYIDANSGKELIRVERKQNTVLITPDENLQTKLHRDYVQKTLEHNNTRIWFSRIDLNREYHTIEFPLRPTFRATMLLKFDNRPMGMLVINTDVNKLLGFSKFHNRSMAEVFVADDKGFYLFHPINPEKNFGFEFGNDYRITKDFPKLKELYNRHTRNISWYDAEKKYLYEASRIDISQNRFIVLLKRASNNVFEAKAQDYIHKMSIYVAIVSIIIGLVSALFAKKITSPIVELTNLAQKIALTKGQEKVEFEFHTGDEIELLADAFKEMLEALLESRREIELSANRLEREVEKKTAELKQLNRELEEKVKKGIEELRQRDEMIMHQSKLADMGEMIGAIAHQWRQPLNALALNIQSLEDMFEAGELDEDTIQEFIDTNMRTINFMSQTIDNFRNFYREEVKESKFNVKKVILDTIEFHRAQLENHNISIEYNLEDLETTGFKNDFMQVLLNLISNSRDAIIERMKHEPELAGQITIECKAQKDSINVVVKDNGGGIPEELTSRIFEPYFTSKEEGKGTGLGLYMAKRIIEEKMKGHLTFRNEGDGAVFEITIDKR